MDSEGQGTGPGPRITGMAHMTTDRTPEAGMAAFHGRPRTWVRHCRRCRRMGRGFVRVTVTGVAGPSRVCDEHRAQLWAAAMGRPGKGAQ